MRSTRVLLATLLAGSTLLSTQAVATAATTPPPAPALSTVTVNPIDVVGATQVVGTVNLSSAATAGGFAVALSSDDPAAAAVPASVTVATGSRSVSFTISTFAVPNTQSALIIATAGTVTTYAILTVHTPSSLASGSIAIIPGGTGNGTITSQPAGINCTLSTFGGTGACSASYPTGTTVRLSAKAAAGSSFQGWRRLAGCPDPSKVVVAAGTTVNCQPGFATK